MIVFPRMARLAAPLLGLTALLVSAGVPAQATTARPTSARPTTARPAADAGGWTIRTVAGGPGGPDPATDVGVAPCAVAFAGGRLLVGQQEAYLGLVSSISMQTGRLTNVAGTVGVPPPDRTQPPTPDGTLATQASSARPAAWR